ncbi:hypothetical protein XNC1_3736 [Xenorhabdus nematophila ATCC 19061]|uniref:Uncharacterized protein n=1 Tax=Xenorhabdus nematophila (strain ATCC 19061 / DSM 3370 / CCUG 14189 / LMG 1036 / NCIMB 9965 / AN6) TaxID=406817 RepID=D3VAZ2_XENNA|nr:hypothetical protein XNC1_3736 [Xenorhabdus nematophila ATCC 19061]
MTIKNSGALVLIGMVIPLLKRRVNEAILRLLSSSHYLSQGDINSIIMFFIMKLLNRNKICS